MVAGRIKQFMEDNGISQAWLARKLDIPPATMNGILNGNQQLKADMFIQICKLLRVSPEEIGSD